MFVIAHGDAVERCNILHRDVSVNNIMFTREGGTVKGLLIDWDQAKSTRLLDQCTGVFRTVSLAPFNSVNNN